MLRSDPATTRTFDALGTLLLAQQSRNPTGAQWFGSELGYVEGLSQLQLQEFLKQAEMQRVLRRTLAVLHDNLPRALKGPVSDLLDRNISAERHRVEKALAYLRRIIDHFEERGSDAIGPRANRSQVER